MIRGFVGVIHLPPLPGDPRHSGTRGFDAAEDAVIQDAEALVKGGVDALIVENFGSAPFVKGTAGHAYNGFRATIRVPDNLQPR